MLHRDGKLLHGQAETLEAHLRVCISCRLEYHRLQAALAEVQWHTKSSTKLEPGLRILAGLRAGIEQWESAKFLPGRDGEILKQRVARQIGPFLGDKAARRILESVSDDGHDLLSIIEPVLARFLGCAAASELVRQIVDASILRA